ncbi:60S ribosomal protein L24 [Salpingoeca rosetta]|uniref:60S ribosomal protein L24 n=1 Tax=Salpingoeca rosetta (strain ATCC 50818 / BSB-021) TaxID=946362 RepID=F2TY64_SALR5|nr:60S ribosomal protein L24 [Salpingoeca rosetta]EGD76323.1 60S ribosomal protein L24 [Salpingoeca rosetta]|eukprot:XP_004998498.1 60S ribosomal protein L24 [Salpingoeca rosetta]
MKLELCSFSGYKIHPGHGRTLVKADGKTFFFLGSKVESLFYQRKNPRKIAWTVLYRRKHKKGIATTTTKRRTRRTQKFTRSIEGLSKERILELKNQSKVQRQAARQQTARKARAKKQGK